MAAGRKSEAERQELKLRKKLKQIQHLETLQRPLSKEELAKVGKKEVAPEFFTQKSISGPRPIPIPCSYRICVANHNTRHTADR